MHVKIRGRPTSIPSVSTFLNKLPPLNKNLGLDPTLLAASGLKNGGKLTVKQNELTRANPLSCYRPKKPGAMTAENLQKQTRDSQKQFSLPLPEPGVPEIRPEAGTTICYLTGCRSLATLHGLAPPDTHGGDANSWYCARSPGPSSSHRPGSCTRR